MSTTQLSSPETDARTDHRFGSGIYLAFVPWVLFTLITQHDTLKAAAIAALLASVLVATPSLRVGRPKVLELAATVAFAGFTVAAFTLDPSATHSLERYARAIAALLLALIAFGSLLAVPFTEQYARETVSRESWDSPRFKQINRQLTRMWGCVFLGMMLSHVIAGALDTQRGNTIFNWVVPIVLIVWAVKRTGVVTGAA